MSVSEAQGRPNIFARAAGILFRTRREWDLVAPEPDTVGGLFTRYFLILAALPALAVLVRSLVIGWGFMGAVVKPDVMSAIVSAAYVYGFGLLGGYLFGLIIEFLAPNFGAEKNRVQAMKVALYGSTAGCLAGLALLLPKGEFLALLGLYDFWLIFTGLPRVMKVSPRSALPYTLISTLVLGVIMLVILLLSLPIVSAVTGMARFGGAGGPSISGSVNVPGVGNADLGEMEKGLKELEKAQDAPSLELGALKAALPETLPGGWTRTTTESNRGEAGGFTGSTAEAAYTKGESRIDLTIGESSALGALAGLASAFSSESERDDGNAYERIGEVDGRLTMEEFDRAARKGKYAVMVGERFMVQAEGEGVEMSDLQAAVRAVDPAALERLAR